MHRKKCFLIAVLLFLLTGFLASFQLAKSSPNVSTSSVYPSPPVDWNTTYAGVTYARFLERTHDEGYVVGGSGEQGECLVKTDRLGNLLWNKTYGSTVSVQTVQQTADDGYILIGSGTRGAWLCKTNGTGDMLWNKTYGREGHYYYALSGQQTDDDGFVLAGHMGIDGGAYGSNIFLMKTDVSGNVEWNKTYGGTAGDMAYSVQQTSDHGYILAGETGSFGAGLTDCWLVKTDANGKMEWNKTYGWGWYDTASCVRQTTDGGYVFAGFRDRYDATHGGNAWVAKTNSSGEIEWTDGFSGTPTETGHARAYSVEQTSDGGYIVAGVTSVEGQSGDRMFLLKTHSQGSSFDWKGTYGGNCQSSAQAVIQTVDGGYAICGGIVTGNLWISQLIKVVPDLPLVVRFRYAPANPIVNESIAFDASYSYDRNLDIVSYLWNFNDGNITSTMNPIVVHRYENAGIYNVSLRVVDAEGLNSTYSLVVCAKTPTSISLSTSTPSASVGYSVGILGTLLDLYGSRIRNESVALYYSYSGNENWNPIASALTDDYGGFGVGWVPPASSYFVIKALYAGNYTHVESSKNVTLSIMPYGEAYLFSVESNSTVSSMGFDTTSQTLSFTATGEKGTVGYAKVTAAKSLVPDFTTLSVYVDGARYDYNLTEANDSWVLLFAYDHSVHIVEIQLDSTIPEFTSFLLVLFMAATLVAVIVCSRKAIHGGEKFG